MPRPRLEISPRGFLYAARLGLPRSEHVVRREGGSCAERCSGGRMDVSTPLLRCRGRAAQEGQGVIVSPVCDLVHSALYDLSRKLLTIFISQLQGFGSLQKLLQRPE